MVDMAHEGDSPVSLHMQATIYSPVMTSDIRSQTNYICREIEKEVWSDLPKILPVYLSQGASWD